MTEGFSGKSLAFGVLGAFLFAVLNRLFRILPPGSIYDFVVFLAGMTAGTTIGSFLFSRSADVDGPTTPRAPNDIQTLSLSRPITRVPITSARVSHDAVVDIGNQDASSILKSNMPYELTHPMRNK